MLSRFKIIPLLIIVMLAGCLRESPEYPTMREEPAEAASWGTVGDHVSLGVAGYDVRAYGAKGDGTTDDSTAIGNAASAASGVGTKLIFASGTYRVSDDITLSSPIVFLPGAKLSIDNTKTVTVRSDIIADDYQQIKTGNGTLDISAANMKYTTPQHFGAVGDGTTDDAAAFSDMMSSIGSNGFTVYIPAGTPFLVGSEIACPSKVTIRGDGPEVAEIKIDDNYTNNSDLFDFTSKTDITISGLFLDGNLANQGIVDTSDNEQRALYFDQCSRINISNCYFKDWGKDGIYFRGNCANAVVSNCVFDNTRRAGIVVISATQLQIANNSFVNGTAQTNVVHNNGIHLEPNSSAHHFKGMTITGNTFKDMQGGFFAYTSTAYNPDQYGIVVNSNSFYNITKRGACVINNTDGIDFVGNTFYGCGNDADGEAYYYNGGAISIFKAPYTNISNNKFHACGGHFSTVYVGTNCHNVTISANKFYNDERRAIYLGDPGQSDCNRLIIGNLGEAGGTDSPGNYAAIEFVHGSNAYDYTDRIQSNIFHIGATGYLPALKVDYADETMECRDNSFWGNANRITVSNGTLGMRSDWGSDTTLSADGTFTAADGEHFILDANGSDRNFNPSGTFAKGHTITVYNDSAGSEVITFDSGSLAHTIAKGDWATFTYKGTGWGEAFPDEIEKDVKMAKLGIGVSPTELFEVEDDDAEATMIIHRNQALADGSDIATILFKCLTNDVAAIECEVEGTDEDSSHLRFYTAAGSGNVNHMTLESGGALSAKEIHRQGGVYDVKHMDYGAEGDGVTNDYAAINAAHTAAAAAGQPLYFPAGIYPLGSSLTFTSDVIFDVGASVNANSGVTLTFQGAVVVKDRLQRVFNPVGTGTFDFTAADIEYFTPQMWGAVGDGVTDDYDELGDASTFGAAAGIPVVCPAGTYSIGTNLSLGADVVFESEASIQAETGVTVTFQGNVTVKNDMKETFKVAGTGSYNFDSASIAYFTPQMWGCVGDGLTDDTANMREVLAAAGACSHTIPVVIPDTGNKYIMDSTMTAISCSTGMVIEGRGMPTIQLKSDANNDYFYLTASGFSGYSLNDSTAIGDTTITLANATGLSVGDLFYIYSTTDAETSWNRDKQDLSIVAAIAGNDVTLADPLHFTYNSGAETIAISAGEPQRLDMQNIKFVHNTSTLDARSTAFFYFTNGTIENIELVNETGTQDGKVLKLQRCYNMNISDVSVDNAGYGVYLRSCRHINVQNVVAHDCHHAVSFADYSSDCTVRGVQASYCDGSIDVHQGIQIHWDHIVSIGDQDAITPRSLGGSITNSYFHSDNANCEIQVGSHLFVDSNMYDEDFADYTIANTVFDYASTTLSDYDIRGGNRFTANNVRAYGFSGARSKAIWNETVIDSCDLSEIWFRNRIWVTNSKFVGDGSVSAITLGDNDYQLYVSNTMFYNYNQITYSDQEPDAVRLFANCEFNTVTNATSAFDDAGSNMEYQFVGCTFRLITAISTYIVDSPDYRSAGCRVVE